MIPGAIFSTGYDSLEAMGPLPSSGSPKASTTRPNKPFPTGTCRSFPVALTSSPSFRWVKSPMMIAPTSVSSRLRANPVTPPGNSIISFKATPERPSIFATPSPISRIRPVCFLVTSDFSFPISASISATIPLMFWLLTFWQDLGRPGERLQAPTDGRVPDITAHANSQTA